MKKPVIILSFICFTIILLSLVQAVVSSRLSTTGVELTKIEQEINTYKKENSVLMEELLKESSYNKVASYAAELGFTGNTETFSLSSSIQVARKQ